MATYLGKYRGTVVDNIDPLSLGRILVKVPGVPGAAVSSWAMPCLPFAGRQSGMYVVPDIGSGVWVEFEEGRPELPVWVGGFWEMNAEIPTQASTGQPGRQVVILQTSGKNSLTISDASGTAGGIVLKSAGGASISVSDAGITISNGKGATIEMVGPAVSINAGALEVV